MTRIKKFDEAIANKVGNLKEAGINRIVFNAYKQLRSSGNKLINFDDTIWDEDVPAIVETLRENDIHEFTISATSSSLIRTLAEFEKNGYKVNGFTMVNAREAAVSFEEQEQVIAIKMTL